MRKQSMCLVVLHSDFGVRGIVASALAFIKYLFLCKESILKTKHHSQKQV